MIRKLILFCIVFNIIVFIYANGLQEESWNINVQQIQDYKELEDQYNVRIAPLLFSGSGIYDFIYINDENIIIKTSTQFVDINMLTNVQKRIDAPELENTTFYQRYFQNIVYDQLNNSLHMHFDLNNQTSLYYILHLDNYTWELIEEIGDNPINISWYDSENKLIYINYGNIIKIFDLQRRYYINSIELPQELYSGYYMYGYPLRILASPRNDTNNWTTQRYVIYDTESKKIFPENNEIPIEFSSGITQFISINNEGLFYGILRKGNGRGGDLSDLVLLDVYSNIEITMALENFPYAIYNFKKISEDKYAFMMQTRDIFGGHGRSFLCFWDYP